MISCLPELQVVHDGLYFLTDKETKHDIEPTMTPIIREAQTSMEPEQALTPSANKKREENDHDYNSLTSNCKYL